MPPKRRKMATSISIDFVSTDDEGKGSAAAPIDLVSTDDETEASQEVTVKATTLPESTASETCIMHIASNLKVFRSMSHTELALWFYKDVAAACDARILSTTKLVDPAEEAAVSAYLVQEGVPDPLAEGR